jgi:hypothetical protein
MDAYRYEQARSRKDDKYLYDFQRSSSEEDKKGNDKVGADFWSELKRENQEKENDNDNDNDNDDDDKVKEKRHLSVSQRIRLCIVDVIDFYRPNVAHAVRNYKDNDEYDDYNIQEEYDITTLSNIENEVKKISHQLRLGSCVICGVSVFFWCWAIKNTITMKSGQDLGMYSFFTTLLSSHYVLWKTRRPISRFNPLATTMNRILISSSHVLVFLNYCLGVLFAFTVGSHIYYIFGTYCIIFSGLWGFVSFRGFTLMSSLQAYESELTRDDEVRDEIDNNSYF